MQTHILVFLGLILLGLVLIGLGIWIEETVDYLSDWELLAVFCTIIGAAMLVGIAIVWPATSLTARYDKQNCYKFGQQTERTVKFVRYRWDSWECLTPSHDGKWVDTDQLMDVSQ